MLETAAGAGFASCGFSKTRLCESGDLEIAEGNRLVAARFPTTPTRAGKEGVKSRCVLLKDGLNMAIVGAYARRQIHSSRVFHIFHRIAHGC